MTQTNETEGHRGTSMRVPGRRGVGLQFREPPGVGGEGAETLPRALLACQLPQVATLGLRPTLM